MEFDSCLPGILTSYDGKKGNVRPLISIRMVDGSYAPFPEVEDVPIISPATAFSGIKLPIRVGDKVVLHMADKDIQTLLFDKSTAGLDDPENALPPTNRAHNLSDAVAYTGFQSLDDMIPTDEDVWIFNNTDSDSYNHIRVKGDGSIEVKTLNATGTLDKNGDIEFQNNTCSLKMTDLGNISLNNTIASTVMNPLGNIHTNNAVASTIMDPLGNITTTNGTTTVNQAAVLGAVTVTATGPITAVSTNSTVNVTSPTSTVNVVAGTAATITAPLVNVTAALTNVIGNLNVTGSITSGTTIAATTQVTASGVNLTTHKHSSSGNPPLNPS